MSFWYWKLYFKNAGFPAVYLLVRNLFSQIFPLATSFLFAKAVDLIIGLSSNGYSSTVFFTQAKSIIIWYCLLYFIDFLLSFDEHLLQGVMVEEKFFYLFRFFFIKKISELDYAQIENPKTQNLYYRAWNLGQGPMKNIVNDLILWLSSLLGAVIYFISASKIDTIAIIPLFLISIVSAIVGARRNKIAHDLYKENNPRQITIWRIYDFFTRFTTVLEAKISGGEKYLEKKYEGISQKIISKKIKAFYPFSITRWSLLFLRYFLILSLYVILINQTFSGRISVGELTFYSAILIGISSRINQLIVKFADWLNILPFARFFYEFSNLKPMLKNGDKDIPVKEEGIKIEFKNVWFKYPEAKKWVLKDINLQINAGEEIAIVGENGAGKTTLIKLILRAFKPQKGQVLINDLDIGEIKQTEIIKNFKATMQDFARYPVLTAAENIGLSEPKRLKNIKAIKEAALLADADEFISSLPKGYQTILSKELEGGTELSTGQWQKIALARIFFNPGNLIIMDEPTASLDPLSEMQIFNNVYKTIKGKTVIIVSHRYRTIVGAQRIIILKNGKIIEQGTHENLIAKDGYYAKAYKAQKLN